MNDRDDLIAGLVADMADRWYFAMKAAREWMGNPQDEDDALKAWLKKWSDATGIVLEFNEPEPFWGTDASNG